MQKIFRWGLLLQLFVGVTSVLYYIAGSIDVAQLMRINFLWFLLLFGVVVFFFVPILLSKRMVFVRINTVSEVTRLVFSSLSATCISFLLFLVVTFLADQFSPPCGEYDFLCGPAGVFAFGILAWFFGAPVTLVANFIYFNNLLSKNRRLSKMKIFAIILITTALLVVAPLLTLFLYFR